MNQERAELTEKFEKLTSKKDSKIRNFLRSKNSPSRIKLQEEVQSLQNQLMSKEQRIQKYTELLISEGQKRVDRGDSTSHLQISKLRIPKKEKKFARNLPSLNSSVT